MSPPRIVAVIPARLASTRLPRKVLLPIAGRPMLCWVVEAALACPQLDAVLVATDSGEVLAVCEENGWPAVLTSPDLASGSDRVHAALGSMAFDADIVVNIQADEPLLRAEHIDDLLAPFLAGADPESIDVTTLKVICSPENRTNPNAVKVVTAGGGRALYFSRSPIPFDRDGTGTPVWKHLGLYAYRLEALRRFHALAPGPLEQTERLEQLRFLENGMSVHVVETRLDTIGVDTEDDLTRVQQMLSSGPGASPDVT